MSIISASRLTIARRKSEENTIVVMFPRVPNEDGRIARK
jgi:hypothetical protein